jgi:hypothetical protein
MTDANPSLDATAADTGAVAADVTTEANTGAGEGAGSANVADAAGDSANADAGKQTNAKAGTIADAGDDTGGDGEGDAPGDADWRKEFAGGDEKVLKRISRYASPQGIVKALIAAQDKVQEKQASAGKLPEDATDEQRAEWRKAQGIPDKPDAYQLPKVAGYDWSDADKTVASDFFTAAHEANMTQAQAERAFSWYADRMQTITADQYEKDTSSRNALEDDLRSEWGPEYRANVKMLARYAEQTPGAGASILEARLPDGRRLGEVPEFVKDLVERARDHYGDSSFIAGDGGSSMNNRKAEIEKVMKSDINRYRSEGLDKEYRTILEAEQRSNKR